MTLSRVRQGATVSTKSFQIMFRSLRTRLRRTLLDLPREGFTDKQLASVEGVQAAEMGATLAGMAAFARAKTAVGRSSSLLRRNIHRLEKGLLMPQRRSVFGEKFIGETVALYTRLVASDRASAGETKWAHDVLSRYFDAVDVSVGQIAPAWEAWQQVAHPATPGADAAPYPLGEIGAYAGAEALPGFEAFETLCRTRRSQRWFKQEQVPEDRVEAAMRAALQAPSACNRQPFSFHLATSPRMVKAITDLPLGTAGFGGDLPAVIAVVGDLSAFAEPRDRHLIYVDSALASMQFMLGLTAQGLGSVPINWPDIPENHEALRGLLGLEAHHVPVMLIGLGVPREDCMIAYSAKKSVSEVLIRAEKD